MDYFVWFDSLCPSQQYSDYTDVKLMDYIDKLVQNTLM